MAEPETMPSAPRAGSRRDLARPPDPALLRTGIALLLVAVLGIGVAHVLGEYDFTGAAAVLSGAVVGLLAGELVVAVGRHRTLPVGVGAGLLAAGALVWAGYRSAGEGLLPITGDAYLAAGAAGAAALLRIVLGAPGRRRGRRSRPVGRHAR